MVQLKGNLKHADRAQATYWPKARGPQLWIFVDMILEFLDSWLDSKISKLILVIYQIRAHASHDS